eukprot:Hpha_TRINITY_DN11567_c0_g1::TRINITY_DN11567_c0_g1_i2::g.32345::m.32345
MVRKPKEGAPLEELLAQQRKELAELQPPEGAGSYDREEDPSLWPSAKLLLKEEAEEETEVDSGRLPGLLDVATKGAMVASDAWEAYCSHPLETLSGRRVDERFCIVAAPAAGQQGSLLRALSGALSSEAGAVPFPLHCVLVGPVQALPVDVLMEITRAAVRAAGKRSFAIPLTEVGGGEDGWDVFLRSGEVGHFHTATRDMLSKRKCGGTALLRRLAAEAASAIGCEHCDIPALDREFVVGVLRGAAPDKAAELLRRVSAVRDARQQASIPSVLHVDRIGVWITADEQRRDEWKEVAAVVLADEVPEGEDASSGS